MHNNNTQVVKYKELLKLNVEQKFGKQVKYSKDCRLLSHEVYQATGKQLSISTIKRFFGLINSPFNPSKYTLDTFSDYLGMMNWMSFIETINKEAPGNLEKGSVDPLRASFQSITETSCISLSRKVRFKDDTFIYRTFSDTFFEEFMQSGKTTTMLVAPAGYGKSAILLQWIKSYFSGKDSRFADDVVCLIDGGIFFTFYNQAQDNELLIQLFDFDFKTIQNLFVKQKTNPQKVRYLIIIDDVDRIFAERVKYYQFAENIMRLIMLNQDNPWFKMILTCRPENLDIFTSLINNNPLLAEAFFNVRFNHKNHIDAINVPLFGNDEIITALAKLKGTLSYYYLSLYCSDVLNIINTPSFFSYLVHDKDSGIDEFSDIDFLNHLIQHFYYSHPFAEEKQLLIKKFLQLCSLDDDFTSVNKNLLLEETGCRLAYQELIKAGLLHEYFDSSDSSEVQLKVRFSNNIIFEYSLARALIREKGENSTLLHTVFVNFRETIALQYALLKWFVKIAFYEGNFVFLRQVHQIMERQVNISNELNNESMPGTLRSIHSAFSEGLRAYKSTSEGLISALAKSLLGQRLYFEEYFDMDNLMFFPDSSLEIYAQNNNSSEGEMIVKYIRFVKSFYSLDYNKCSLEFESISKINFTELKSSLCIGYYFSSWFLYASIKNYQKKEEMLNMFLKSSAEYRLKNSPATRFNPGLEYLVVYNLNIGDFFDDVRLVAEYLLTNYEFNHNKSSCFYQCFILCYARSLLHTGEQVRALELFREVKFEDFPFHIKHFMQLHVNITRYDFLKCQKNITEALSLLTETRSLAKQMGYSYFIQKTGKLEAKLLKEKKDISK